MLSSSSNSHVRLVRVLYKGLIRAARKMDAATPPAAAAPVETFGLLSRSSGLVRASGVSSSHVAAVRAEFASRKGLPVGSAQLNAAVDAAIAAVSKANRAVLELTTPAAALVPSAVSILSTSTTMTSAAGAIPALAPPSPSTPNLFSVGQVVRHATGKFRGVIVARDASFKASEAWARRAGLDALPNGRSQPFYYLLSDLRDCPDARVCYVAQDLLLPAAAAAVSADAAPASASATATSAAASLVLHPLLSHYFKTLRVSGGSGASASAGAEGAALVSSASSPMLLHYEPHADAEPSEDDGDGIRTSA